MTILTHLKNKYYIIIPLVLLTIILLTNIQHNMYVMGLDNITPFFNSTTILEKIYNSNGEYFFSLFPITFILPFFEILKTVNLPLWIINQGYLFISLILGVLGAGYLIKRVTGSNRGYLFGSLLYLSSLVTIWVFNQPNYFFITAYASIPWLIEWGIAKKNTNTKTPTYLWIVRIISLILFFQTTINIVVTVAYGFAILLIQFAINMRDGNFKEEATKVLKRLLISIFVILAIWQIGILFTGNSELVTTKIYSHYTQIQQNPLTENITKDLQASGILRNTLLNNITYKNAWVETHTEERGRLFQNYEYYTGIVLTLALIPFLLALLTLASKEERTKNLYLHLTIILGLVLMSSTIVKGVQDIPILSEAFRWSSSKFWPLTLIPITILASIYATSLKGKLSPIVLTIFCVIFIYPTLTGQLFSNQLTTTIPSEYMKIDKQMNNDSTYYYLPLPQDSYFYTYDFGYFGSDFISYITTGNWTTYGIVPYFENSQEYNEAVGRLETCTNERITTKIIWDDSITETEGSINQKKCLDNKYKLIYKDGNLYIYE